MIKTNKVGVEMLQILSRNGNNVEHERDAAWDDAYAAFPDADYIESF